MEVYIIIPGIELERLLKLGPGLFAVVLFQGSLAFLKKYLSSAGAVIANSLPFR